MLWLNKLVLAVCLSLPLSTATFHAQENPPATEPTSEFFSGTIVDASNEKITVARTVLGHTENHDFIINSDTKIEGKIKPKARVTVGFKPSEQGDVAVRIIVRSQKS